MPLEIPTKYDSLLKKKVSLKTSFTFMLIIVLIIWSFIYTGFNFGDLMIGIPQIGDLFKQMIPPDFEYLQQITTPMLDTIRMAIVSTVLGSIVSIPIALLCASNIVHQKWISIPSRFILNIVRTIPDLLLAAIFVAVFGIGQIPGILALFILTICIIGKLLYESLETIDPGPMEAMTAVGANKIKWIVFGVVPQAISSFMSYVLYAFEVNIRASAVLGLVGAGGIGLFYDQTLGLFQYPKTATIILFTLVIVVVIDYISTKVRAHLAWTQEIAKYNVHTKAHKRKLIKRWLIAIVVLAIIIWAFAGVPSLELKSKSLEILKSIFSGLFHPDISYIYIPDGEDLLRGLLETFAIAVVGTFIAAIICIPLAFLGANNMVKLRPVSGVSKFILSVIRVFPEIVMALIFIKAVGPGSFSGVLALGIHSVGMLGKLLAEDIEGLDFSAVESLKASGANKIKTLVFAVIPQIMPAFLSLILYRFELNLRSASILGLIGAGGIGTPLIFAIQTRSWDRVGIILIGLVLMVAIVDLISGSIRKRIV